MLYPNKKIIGWQHTHPNYGIFLSNYDLFIQDNFFNMPFQVAYVIDPIQNIRGFFQWKNGKTEKLKGYYVYDEVGKPIKIEQKKLESSENKKTAPSKVMRILISILCVLTVALGIFSININNKYNKQLKIQETILNILEEQENTINNQEMDLQQLQDLVGSSTEDGDKIVRFVAYTVKSGDSLSKICGEHNLDYQANKNIILSLNGITEPNSIYSGQVILLPIQ